MELHERIRKAADFSGLQPSEAAAACGLPLSTYQHYRDGHTRKVKISVLKDMAVAFGVSLSWLRTGEGEMIAQAPEPPPDKLRELERQIDRLEARLEQSQADMDRILERHGRDVADTLRRAMEIIQCQAQPPAGTPDRQEPVGMHGGGTR